MLPCDLLLGWDDLRYVHEVGVKLDRGELEGYAQLYYVPLEGSIASRSSIVVLDSGVCPRGFRETTKTRPDLISRSTGNGKISVVR